MLGMLCSALNKGPKDRLRKLRHHQSPCRGTQAPTVTLPLGIGHHRLRDSIQQEVNGLQRTRSQVDEAGCQIARGQRLAVLLAWNRSRANRYDKVTDILEDISATRAEEDGSYSFGHKRVDSPGMEPEFSRYQPTRT